MKNDRWLCCRPIRAWSWRWPLHCRTVICERRHGDYYCARAWLFIPCYC